MSCGLSPPLGFIKFLATIATAALEASPVDTSCQAAHFLISVYWVEKELCRKPSGGPISSPFEDGGDHRSARGGVSFSSSSHADLAKARALG